MIRLQLRVISSIQEENITTVLVPIVWAFFNSIQDDHTNSGCTFVPCAAGLLPYSTQEISPGEICRYEQESWKTE